MHADRAEVALSPAALMGVDGELDRLKALDRALGTVVGVQLSGKRKVRNRVHLLFVQVVAGRILDKKTVINRLAEPLGGDGVVVVIEGVEHVDVLLLVLKTLRMRRELDVLRDGRFGDVADSLDIFVLRAVAKGDAEFFYSALSHAVDHQVGF